MRITIDIKCLIIIFLFFLSFISPIFLVKKTTASTTDLPIIKRVNKINFQSDFDSNYLAIDKENKRLFISYNGIKIYNITNPKEPQIVGNIDDSADYCMKFHNDLLFIAKQSGLNQVIRIYSISNDNTSTFVGETEHFDYGTNEDVAVSKIYFPREDLMVTCGHEFIRFWNITDLSNITCYVKFDCDEFFYDNYYVHEYDFSIQGMAFHPLEDKALIALKYAYHWGEVHLIDFSNRSKPILIPLTPDMQTGTINSLIDNAFYPCFVVGSNFFRVLDWQNASNPIQISELKLEIYEPALKVARFVLFDTNQVLSYQVVTGIIDLSNTSEIQIITEFNHDIQYDRDFNIKSYHNPAVFGNYTFALTHEYIGNQKQNQLNIYELIYTPSPENNSISIVWFTLLALIPFIFIPLVFILKRKFL
ncbi:MAG: hypothetical protein FK730_08105 [Asgard group archaeon]|nr:hypothetical protein [Asgard group archaeon]